MEQSEEEVAGEINTNGVRNRNTKSDSNISNNADMMDSEPPGEDKLVSQEAVEQISLTIRRVSGHLHFHALPSWLQDNDYLHRGHRAPTDSFRACFRSIFGLHTETFNIWTHMLGCLVFAGVALHFIFETSMNIRVQEKLLFLLYFLGAITCLGFSFVFHTVCCHSERVSSIFNKLDYCGIAILIVVSFVPWVYYCFYDCRSCKLLYISITVILGISSITVSLWDKFSNPHLRPFRAAIFVVFGLSGAAPAVHYGIRDGWTKEETLINIGWLVLMGGLYITGAVIYAFRIPERIFPGKCDIVFQSHQIFHVCVVVAAFVHYYAILQMAKKRVILGIY